MIYTPLCELLGIEHPILNAPMSGTATAELATAVSEADGFGMIGGTSRGGPDWLRAQIRAVRERTGRPFGVGFISSFPGLDDLIQVALDEQVTAINHSFADPTPYVEAAHRQNVKIFAQVQTVAQALVAARAGVDVIIAQGTEAGGHTGSTAGTLALVPAVVDAVNPIPVVAAGGIADGRGVAAVLMLGASGAWLGTRFVASREWGGRTWEQAAVLAATVDDTVRTSVYDAAFAAPFPEGIADRMLHNRFIARWQGRENEVRQNRQAILEQLSVADQEGDVELAGISSGVSAGLITTLEPAGEIVHRLIADAETLLHGQAQRLLRLRPCPAPPSNPPLP
ncbi:MAG TPA: nitronate monooxygenase [Chloroflexia bacterium]|nr:nitronate monooxygenase [Chloroflexia bacterium]